MRFMASNLSTIAIIKDKTMIFSCPKCGESYREKQKNFFISGQRKCKRCGSDFLIILKKEKK